MAKLRLSLTTKLLASALVLLTFLIGIVYAAEAAFAFAQREYADSEREMGLALGAQRMQAMVYRQGMSVRSFMLYENDAFIADFQTATNEVLSSREAMVPLTRKEETRRELEEIKAIEADYIPVIERVVAQMRSGQGEMAMVTLNAEAVPRVQRLVALTTGMTDRLARQAEAHAQATAQRVNQVKMALLIGAALAAVIGLAVSVWIALRVSGPIRRLADVAGRVAAGDLSAKPLPVTSSDESGALTEAFNQMLASLREIIDQVARSSQTISSSSDHLSGTTQEVAQSANGVSQAVEQVARGASGQSQAAQSATQTVGELRTAIQQIASGAQHQAASAQDAATVVTQMVAAGEQGRIAGDSVASSARQALTVARSGREVVAHSASGMAQIRQSVVASADQIRQLGQVSTQIGEITLAITEIAEQTNLLALNAAIEAARAGEHGRGFAVVAEEVRKLAERAARSAREISGLIQSTQVVTAKAVTGMEQVVAEVNEGTRLTDDAGAALSQIVTVVGQTEHDVQTIIEATAQFVQASRKVMEAVNFVASVTEENTAAAEQMTAGSEQVLESITDIAAVSEENAAAAEEVSASMAALQSNSQAIAGASEELTRVARQLQEQVTRFRL